MTKLTMMVGIPASGKSTLAADIAGETGAAIFSSDKLRLEMFGDESSQEDNKAVFEELHRRIKEALKNGQDVIYDATNVNAKKRRSFINSIGKDIKKEAQVMVVPFKRAWLQDLNRERSVGKKVIDKFVKLFQFPQYSEGWDEIVLNNHEAIKPATLSFDNLSYDEFKKMLYTLSIDDMIDSPQNSPYHSLSIDRHTYKVYKYFDEGFFGSRRHLMLLAAIFHDSGKTFCRETDKETLYDKFYKHENVSAQIAALRLFSLGFSDEYVLFVVDMVQNHMLFLSEEKYQKEKKKMEYPERFKLMEFFSKADRAAK